MNSAAAAALLQPKPRPYYRIFTSAFHSRFVHALLLSLFICWDTAILLSPQFDIFWSWFPLGFTGIRTLLFCIAILFIFILQVATITVGEATPKTPLQRLSHSLCSTATFKTGFWYIASAWWFTEVYIWTCSNLTWVTKGDLTSPDRLNERPIWFRAFFTVLGVVHAVKHVYFAHSVLHLPVLDAGQSQEKHQRTHSVPDVWTYFRSQARGMVIRSAASSVAATILCAFTYGILLRQSLWKIHLALAKVWFDLPRSESRATGIPPVLGTIPRVLYVGFWLGLAWEFAALSLLAYFKKPPLKNDVPWTSGGSDPNGSLLNGLKSRRGLVKTFAFWELAIIAESHSERRKAIFADIERKTGPIWTSMLTEALKVLKEVDDRIQPPLPPDPSTLDPPETLPKILREPRAVADVGEERDLLAPANNRKLRARQKLLEIADDKMKQLGSNPETLRLPEIPATTSVTGQVQSYTGRFLWPSSASKINATVLGNPHSHAATIVDAIEAITKMLSASLQEDAFGKAMDGVPGTVKQFTRTIRLIEGLLQESPPDGNITDVEIILRRLKTGLAELLTAFQMFLGNTALGIADLNAARKASGLLDAEKAEEKRASKARSQQAHVQDEDEAEAEEDLPEEGWREWSRPKTTSKLFADYDPYARTRRQVSGGNGTNGRTMGFERARPMEQVR